MQGPGGEAGVMRIKGSGTFSSDGTKHERGLAMALAGNGRWCHLDPKLGAMHAVAEAARKVACTGATPVAATNCLNFGNPEKPEIMRQLSDAIDGIAEACTVLGTPITGGNVSLYNETRGEGIYPTPVVGIVGILDDASKAVSSRFQSKDDILVLLTLVEGATGDKVIRALGSSEFAKSILQELWGTPPKLDIREEVQLRQCLMRMVGAGLVKSVRDVGHGGLAVALAEIACASDIGAVVTLEEMNSQVIWPDVCRLFSEDATQAILSCSPANYPLVKEISEGYSLIDVKQLGITGGARVKVHIGTRELISAAISELKQPWADALEDTLATSPVVDEVMA